MAIPRSSGLNLVRFVWRTVPLVVVSAILFVGLARAELYRWVDEEGVTNMTTSRDQVPEKYRDRVTVVAESSSDTAHRAVIAGILLGCGILFLGYRKLRAQTRASSTYWKSRDRARQQRRDRDGPRGRRTRPAVPKRDEYQVLGVQFGANTDEIHRAYLSRMHEYHPDRVATLGEELRDLAERKTKEFNEAYQKILKANGKR